MFQYQSMTLMQARNCKFFVAFWFNLSETSVLSCHEVSACIVFTRWKLFCLLMYQNLSQFDALNKDTINVINKSFNGYTLE